MSFRLLGEHMSPAEGESTVRTYHCTSISSRLLSLKAQGYLTVTNKRVVFYAFGSSYGGTSVLQSEVPIADVSGISSYKGTYFSLFHFLTALVVSIVAAAITAAIAAGIAGLFLRVALERGSFPNTEGPQFILVFLALVAITVSAASPRDRLPRSIMAACGTMLFSSASTVALAASMANPFFTSGREGNAWSNVLTVVTIIAALYTLVCFFWYSRREMMSLAVGSKGGGNTPITISGMSGFGVYNSAAMRALTAEPAADADALIRELGALITDVQSLGDFGMQKWKAA